VSVTADPPTVPGSMSYRLPREAYRSPAWLEREVERLFETSWSLVAAVEDLPTVGDVLDVAVGRYPLVLARTADGLRAFHNQCRHRGMALVCGPAHAGEQLRCPYHGWEFGLSDGALRRVSQRSSQFADVDLATLGLIPASVAVWEGMVFAHPDADPPPFESFLGDFPSHIGSFRPGELHQVARVELRGAFNWKLFVENHIDAYHLWYLHDETLGDFDHARFQHRALDRNWVSYEPLRPGRRDRVDAERGIGHLDDRDRFGIGAHLLFPNTTMASTAEYFTTYAVFPVSPTESRVDLRVRATDADRAEEFVASARAFIDEDIEACERVQQVMASPAFAVGPLARDHERAIVGFQEHVLACLGGPVPEPERALPVTPVSW
jgi:choline monooxygenase